MPRAIALAGFVSDGSCSLPPTAAIGPYTATSFFGSRPVQLKGVTAYLIHCLKTCHPFRVVVYSGKCTFFLENLPIALESDLITCGDHIASGQSFCEAYSE
jgi:hypothetical protein